jgi:hypothetical protein
VNAAVKSVGLSGVASAGAAATVALARPGRGASAFGGTTPTSAFTTTGFGTQGATTFLFLVRTNHLGFYCIATKKNGVCDTESVKAEVAPRVSRLVEPKIQERCRLRRV